MYIAEMQQIIITGGNLFFLILRIEYPNTAITNKVITVGICQEAIGVCSEKSGPSMTIGSL